MLTTNAQVFPEAKAVDGPSDAQTFRAAEQGFRYWRKVLAEGVVPATREELDGWQPAVERGAGGPVPAAGPARPEAPCQFCEFEALCTVRLERGRR